MNNQNLKEDIMNVIKELDFALEKTMTKNKRDIITSARKSLFSILDEKRRTAYNEWRKENTNETFNKRIEQTPLKQTRISNLADIIEDLDLNNLNRIKIIEYCIKDERKGFIFRKVLKKSGIKPREIINYIAAKRNLNISSKRCENEYDESNRLRDDINNLLYDKIHTPYTHNYHIELWNELLEAFTKCYEKKGNDIKSELKKMPELESVPMPERLYDQKWIEYFITDYTQNLLKKYNSIAQIVAELNEQLGALKKINYDK